MVLTTVASLTVASMSCTASSRARDMDYPQQMAAVNHCYVERIKSGRPPVTDPWADTELRDCMKRQGSHEETAPTGKLSNSFPTYRHLRG
jgi:hypothetical protein